MAAGSAKVIQQVLKLVDGYDLYGRCAACCYSDLHTWVCGSGNDLRAGQQEWQAADDEEAPD